MYKAVHYVNIAGRVYLPGEPISCMIEAEKAERLLRLKAIIETEDARAEAMPEARETAIPVDADQVVEAEAEEAEADVENEDAREIDVSDAIAPAPKAEEKPARKRRAKA